MPIEGFNGFGMPNVLFNFLQGLSEADTLLVKDWLTNHSNLDVSIALLEAVDPTVTIDSSEGVRG